MDRRQIALEAASILLKHITPPPPQSILERISAELILLVEKSCAPDEPPASRHAVLTVIGRNHAGIVHAFSEVLAESNVDIVDINQTIVHGNFAMMMVINPEKAKVDFMALKNLLKERGKRAEVGVFLQYEDLMRELNRI